mmetsp:Transcript_35598/g.78375  ORF Transcript_35598/g.78375 Transcript_35598/m.78375 type:complete len:90 (+) Transcript_35598:19-288(+)
MQGEDKQAGCAPTLQQILKMRPQNVHLGSTPREGVDVGDLIDASPCSAQYYALEACLGEQDRAWSRCQVEVKALRECSVTAKTQRDGKT